MLCLNLQQSNDIEDYVDELQERLLDIYEFCQEKFESS